MTVHGTELHNDFLWLLVMPTVCVPWTPCQCLMTLLELDPLTLMVSILSPSTFHHSSSSSQSSLLELSGPCAPSSLFCVFSFQLLPYPSICSTHVPSCLLLPHSSLSKEDICLLSCPLLEWSSLDIFSTMWLLTLIGFP